MDPIRVLVADDHRFYREGIRSVLAGVESIEVIGEAADGAAAIEQAEQLQPDVILMDVKMPGTNGIEATRRILRVHPATVVILLSTYRAADLPPEARQCGAATYVHKEDFDPGVLRAIWDAHANGESAGRR